MNVIFRNIKLVYEYVVLYGGLFCFALMCLAWSLAAGLLHRLLPKKLGTRLGQYAIMLGFRAYLSAVRASGLVKCDLTALDVLRDEQSLIITTNHPSLIDIVLIASRLPRAVCILKADLVDNPLLGGAARMAGYIRNDFGGSLIRRSMEAAQSGSQLLIFPEGTRTVHPPINDFKDGFGLIARKAGAPIQTVFIEASSTFLGKDWPLSRKPDFPVEYRVRLGRRFEVSGDVKAFVADFENYYRQQLTQVPQANPQELRS